MKERGIFMPGRDHKSGKRKFRQGQPANLWAWLEHAPVEGWKVHPRVYAEDKAEMHVEANLRPMVLKSKADREHAAALRNVWRHSFASYLLAQTSNAPAVGRLMQHSRQSTTEGYEGVAYAADAALYFAITPASVLLTWEQFVATNSLPASP
jgi:integrase